MDERTDAGAGGESPPMVPSGTPVVGADGEPVGHVVAVEPGGLLVEEAGATGGDDARLHVPGGAVAEVGEQGVVLTTTGEAAMATERERAELARAARRGVDVRLLLAGVTDAPLVLAAQRASYGPLIEAGVRILEVKNSVLHAKLGVIDDAWSWVGSSNLDRRSVAWNNEVDAILLEREAAEGLEAAMARGMALAFPMTLDRWRGRGLGQRLRELLALPVADLL